MSTIHFTLMGKGGVGKSFITTILAEYLRDLKGEGILCLDTDPTNPTFSSYLAFGATHINIMTQSMNIDRSNFDKMIDMLLEHQGDCVIDNGASSFLPMMSYICESKLIQFLNKSGKNIVIHAPLVGGLGMDETLRGLDSIVENVPAQVVVWLNEMYGPVTKNGKAFTESRFYEKNLERFKGIVHVPKGESDTTVKTLAKLTANKLTFKEGETSSLFFVMEKQRNVEFYRHLKEQMDAIGL